MDKADSGMNRRQFALAALVSAFSGRALAAGPLGFAANPLDAAEAGLVPGASGDTTAAFAQAAGRAAREGRPLLVRPGDYLLADAPLPEACRIVGHGARFLAAPGRRAIAAKGRRIVLEGLAFEGVAGSGDLVSIGDAAQVDIRNCAFSSAAGSGLKLERCGGSVRDSVFAGCRDAALFSLDCKGLDIAGNEIRDCADNGILVWQSDKREDGAMVTGNRIFRIGAASGGSGQYGNGVNVYRAGNVMVSGNRITDCAFTAVRVNGGDNCQIVANNCARLGEVALYVEFAFQGAVVADNIVDTAGMGISVTNYGNAGGRLAVVSGNLVRNLFTPAYSEPRGVGIGVEADTVVSGNTVENAANFGIAAGWGAAMRDVAIAANVVRTSPVGIAVSLSEGAGKAAITGNRISGASKGAILGMDHDRVVTGDLAAAGARIDPRLTISGNSAGG